MSFQMCRTVYELSPSTLSEFVKSNKTVIKIAQTYFYLILRWTYFLSHGYISMTSLLTHFFSHPLGIGYARIILCIWAFYYSFTDCFMFFFLYGLSAALDMADGHAARLMGQSMPLICAFPTLDCFTLRRVWLL